MAEPRPAPSRGSGEFRLDLEAAVEARKLLEGMRQKLEVARAQAVKLAKAPPTARDAVSLEAFALLAEKADGGPGSFTAAMDAGLAHVDQLLTQMQEDIARQRQLDDVAAARFPNRA